MFRKLRLGPRERVNPGVLGELVVGDLKAREGRVFAAEGSAVRRLRQIGISNVEC